MMLLFLMKLLHFTRHHQRISKLQNLRARKLQLDRTIRELEAYAADAGHSLVPEPPRHLPVVLTPSDETQEQWLQ